MTNNTRPPSGERPRLPPGWKAVLERAAASDRATLELDDAETDAEATAERLADLGLLRVSRARHYSLTVSGRQCLTGKALPPAATTAHRRNPLALLAPVALLVVLGAVAWFMLQ